MPDIGFSCTCGKVRGHVDVASPADGNHLVCHCPDCRAAMIHFGQPDPVDGVDIWQTTADRIHFTRGLDQLALKQLTPRGVFRWYAACCNAPVTSTLRSPRRAMSGFIADRFDDTAALGPVISHVFIGKPAGKYRHTGLLRVVLRMGRLLIGAYVSGRWRQAPFFRDDGSPVVQPQLVSKEDRAAAMQS